MSDYQPGTRRILNPPYSTNPPQEPQLTDPWGLRTETTFTQYQKEERNSEPSTRSVANKDEKGLKYDQTKEPLSLLSRAWLLGVSAVMGFGAKKYAAHNWRNGIERSRLVSAALRHILAYNEGEDLDPETGLSHLDHASCCLMFARELHDTRPDLDDRYKGQK